MPVPDFAAPPRLTLRGYSPESAGSLFQRVQAGARPSELPGDFLLVAEGTERGHDRPFVVFVASPVCAVPHYYAVSGTACVHAPNVFEVCRDAGLAWEWDWDTVAQMILFDHPLGTGSLHRTIARVPACAVTTVCGGTVQVDADPFWDDLFAHRRRDASLRDAGSTLLGILSETPSERPVSLSLSAGFDSRVLLACLSHLGRRLDTASMGSADATDPRIAAELATRVGAPFRRIALDPDDYVGLATDIVHATSGEKTFWHWHTGLFSRHAGFDPGALHLAGSNGEFARSYYFDYGDLAAWADRTRAPGGDLWLRLKNARSRRVPEALLPAVASVPALDRALDARRQVQAHYARGLPFGDGLDRFYATERVRRFIGLGLALYRSSFETMSPFLDVRFLRYAARLRRTDKLASRMHRAVIAQTAPHLLALPTDDSAVPMGQPPGRLYFRARHPLKHYNPYTQALDLEPVRRWAQQGADALFGAGVADADSAMAEAARQWVIPVTLGATLDHVERMGIPRR